MTGFTFQESEGPSIAEGVQALHSTNSAPLFWLPTLPAILIQHFHGTETTERVTQRELEKSIPLVFICKLAQDLSCGSAWFSAAEYWSLERQCLFTFLLAWYEDSNPSLDLKSGSTLITDPDKYCIFSLNRFDSCMYSYLYLLYSQIGFCCFLVLTL